MSIITPYKLFRLATSNESSKPYSAETETCQHTQHTADFWAILYNKKLPELTVGQRAINSSEFNALCFQHVQQLQLWLWVLILTCCHNNSSHSRLSEGDHRHCQRPITPSPAARPSTCGRDCVCRIQAETQQGGTLVFSLYCPPNPLIITDARISLTSTPPCSSDA